MKILLLNDERWDSGITAYFIQISKLLHDGGHDVLLGVRKGKKPARQADQLGLPTVQVENFFDLRKQLKQNKWDVINVHTGRPHTWAVLAQKLLSKNKRVPVVRTRGDASPLKTHFLSRIVYKNTTAVIAASDHVRRQYETGYGFTEEQARTVYPSVAVESPNGALPELTVGVLGRLDPVKGHTILLEAAVRIIEQFPNVKFLVAGKEANLSIQLLQNHAKQLNVDSYVQFLGFQPSAQQFMKRCTVGVIPSIGSEEVSRACLEWMSVGRPVVGTLVGSLPELIEPNETGLLVPAEDSVALADGIIKILKDSQRASQWGHSAQTLVERRFSPKIQLEKTLRVFNWAINHHE